MSDLNKQKSLTDGKGWKKVLIDYGKEKKAQFKTKAKNVLGGVNVIIKKAKGD